MTGPPAAPQSISLAEPSPDPSPAAAIARDLVRRGLLVMPVAMAGVGPDRRSQRRPLGRLCDADRHGQLPCIGIFVGRGRQDLAGLGSLSGAWRIRHAAGARLRGGLAREGHRVGPHDPSRLNDHRHPSRAAGLGAAPRFGNVRSPWPETDGRPKGRTSIATGRRVPPEANGHRTQEVERTSNKRHIVGAHSGIRPTDLQTVQPAIASWIRCPSPHPGVIVTIPKQID